MEKLFEHQNNDPNFVPKILARRVSDIENCRDMLRFGVFIFIFTFVCLILTVIFVYQGHRGLEREQPQQQPRQDRDDYRPGFQRELRHFPQSNQGFGHDQS
jgi:hypothetical protein